MPARLPGEHTGPSPSPNPTTPTPHQQQQQHTNRRSALLALADLTDILGPQGLRPHAFRLARGLLSLLPGRLWDGKEEVLAALVRILAKCPDVVVVEEEGVVGPAGAWLLWEKGARTFPPALLGGGKAEEEPSEAVAAAVEDEAEAGAVAPMEEEAETAAAGSAVDATRDEEAFTRIAAEAADAVDGPTPPPAAAAAAAVVAEAEAEGAVPMEMSSGGEGRVSYHGLVRALVAQCQRPHRDYRRAALGSLTELALAFPNADAFALAQEPLRALIGEAGDGQQQLQQQGMEGGVDHVLRARAVEALGALFPPVPVGGGGGVPGGASSSSLAAVSAHATQQAALSWLLSALLSRATYTVWSLRQAVFRALRRVAERVHVRGDIDDGDNSLLPTLLTGAMVDAVVGACLQGGLGDLKFHQVRAAAVEVLLALVKRREGEARVVLAPQQERILVALDKCVAGDSQPAVVLLATEAAAHFRARA
jgi:hypothetical protein